MSGNIEKKIRINKSDQEYCIWNNFAININISDGQDMWPRVVMKKLKNENRAIFRLTHFYMKCSHIYIILIFYIIYTQHNHNVNSQANICLQEIATGLIS